MSSDLHVVETTGCLLISDFHKRTARAVNVCKGANRRGCYEKQSAPGQFSDKAPILSLTTLQSVFRETAALFDQRLARSRLHDRAGFRQRCLRATSKTSSETAAKGLLSLVLGYVVQDAILGGVAPDDLAIASLIDNAQTRSMRRESLYFRTNGRGF